MPTYVYRREDGTTFEIEQRISEPALTEDPETGRPVARVITGAGLVFRGSGFYLTDYARKAGPGKEESAAGAAAGKEGASAADGGAAPKPGGAAPVAAKPDSKPAESKPAESRPASSTSAD